jgi:hypothetical protein
MKKNPKIEVQGLQVGFMQSEQKNYIIPILNRSNSTCLKMKPGITILFFLLKRG